MVYDWCLVLGVSERVIVRAEPPCALIAGGKRESARSWSPVMQRRFDAHWSTGFDADDAEAA